MMDASLADDEAGSTIVEMLVAAALTVLAVVMLSGNILPALRLLEDAPVPQQRQLELVAAGDLFARAVRSARPEHHRPAIGGDHRALLLAVGPGATVRFELVDGALTVDVEGSPTGMGGLTTRTLVRGLDMERSGFSLLAGDGQVSGAPEPVAAVALALADDESSLVRVVRPRMTARLDGPVPW